MHAYENASDIAREEHVPVIIHVTELTQPQGHSSSGSHERYKSAERLNWEKENDCNKRFREWILETGITTDEELSLLEKNILKEVRLAKKRLGQNTSPRINRSEKDSFSYLKTPLIQVKTKTLSIRSRTT